MFDSLIDMMSSNKSEDIGITFILSEEKEKFVSYNALYEKALRLLYVLQSKGIKPGEKIIIQIEDQEKYIYSLWACIMGGIIPVPLSTAITDEQMSRIFRVYNLFDYPYLLTSDDIFEIIKRFKENASSEIIGQFDLKRVLFYDEIDTADEKGTIHNANIDDVALIMFSSGSTGEPKGVKTTHRNILVTNEDLVEKFNVDSSDVSLHWMPLTHMVGIVFCHLFPIMTATPQYLMDKRVYFRFPKLWFNKICEHRATILLTANFGMKYLMSKIDQNEKHEWDFSHIKLITVGGEPLSIPLVNSFISSFEKYRIKRSMISPVYGVTEAMVVACVSQEKTINTYFLDRGSLSIGSLIKENPQDGISFVGLGTPPRRCKVRICDNEDRLLEDEKVGHIQVGGPNVSPGYYKPNDDAFTADGWYRSGDVGFIKDEEVVITGRAKEMIIVNMVNYYLFDIEMVIEKVDSSLVGNIAACGIQDKTSMEDEVLVFMQYEGDEIHFSELATKIRYSVKSKVGLDLKYIIPLKELPRTAVGKVNRVILKNIFLDGKFDEIINKLNQDHIDNKGELKNKQNEADIRENLVRIIKSVLEIENVNLTDNIFELGAKSLTVMSLSVEIEDFFNVLIDIRSIYERPMIEDICNSIQHLITEKEKIS
ncbi:acyl-CoA synthetase (AMP-forming)/AMP-acid ligase II [Kineothrix alysoides]|uniref:Acyl-CoA synthetase (AMP-forming)/AMP-acid ligase II n=1 Tax=Kineothrix alysoides TaxID=1469948 RepID=A0A4R1QWD2_9FIRM|nr:non-ribosomal peptide synthetase [Kineothrix alysoides]TCL57621.1 acyl-CoA synthetase (AMP-forming)/AMP-acid ligase II [Kineothrix alysoides]